MRPGNNKYQLVVEVTIWGKYKKVTWSRHLVIDLIIYSRFIRGRHFKILINFEGKNCKNHLLNVQFFVWVSLIKDVSRKSYHRG